jgi:hypothetical protein
MQQPLVANRGDAAAESHSAKRVHRRRAPDGEQDGGVALKCLRG